LSEEKKVIALAEAALGENLQWLTDHFNLLIRQGDADVIRRLKQLDAAHIALAKALAEPRATMVVLQFNIDEWNRLARSAYNAGYIKVANRFAQAAKIQAGERMDEKEFHDLQTRYREWLINNKFSD
jgi:hypothetical protein